MNLSTNSLGTSKQRMSKAGQILLISVKKNKKISSLMLHLRWERTKWSWWRSLDAGKIWRTIMNLCHSNKEKPQLPRKWMSTLPLTCTKIPSQTLISSMALMLKGSLSQREMKFSTQVISLSFSWQATLLPTSPLSTEWMQGECSSSLEMATVLLLTEKVRLRNTSKLLTMHSKARGKTWSASILRRALQHQECSKADTTTSK